MSPVLVIARREFAAIVASPLGWGTLAFTQLVVGLFFFVVFLWDFMSNQRLLVAAGSSFGITAYVVAPTLKSASLILLLVTPLLSMRSFAEERRAGTFTLLMSAPLSMRALVLGKYLGLLAFVLLGVAGMALMPVSLGLGGPLDRGLLAACVLALVLLAMTFTAAGVFVSSLCRQPATAAMATLALLVVLWVIDASGSGNTPVLDSVLRYLSVTRHLDALMRGVVSSADVAYFGLMTAGFLALTVRRLDALRTSG